MSFMWALDRPDFNPTLLSKSCKVSMAFLKHNLFANRVQSNFVSESEGFLAPEWDILTVEESNLLLTDSCFEIRESQVDACDHLVNLFVLIIKLVDNLPFGGRFLTFQSNFYLFPDLHLRSSRKDKYFSWCQKLEVDVFTAMGLTWRMNVLLELIPTFIFFPYLERLNSNLLVLKFFVSQFLKCDHIGSMECNFWNLVLILTLCEVPRIGLKLCIDNWSILVD